MLSLQKAASILGAFSAEQPEWGVRALAAHLTVPRATAHAYLAGLTDAGWNKKAPLWYYVLKEAELVNGGTHLGPVGGRIVAETILGILACDKTSYLYAPGGYVPEFPTVGDFLLAAGTGRHMAQDAKPA